MGPGCGHARDTEGRARVDLALSGAAREDGRRAGGSGSDAFGARHRAAVRDRVFFFNDTAASEIYTLSLHAALPILILEDGGGHRLASRVGAGVDLVRRVLQGELDVGVDPGLGHLAAAHADPLSAFAGRRHTPASERGGGVDRVLAGAARVDENRAGAGTGGAG